MPFNKIFTFALLFFIFLNLVSAETIIVDNKSSDFSFTGYWETDNSPGYHVTDYLFTGTDTYNSSTATWSASFKTSGTFEIAAWFAGGPDRAPDAKYIIDHSGGTAIIEVDQSTTGSKWLPLGTFQFPAPFADVTLVNSSSLSGKIIVADAIRFRRAGTIYSDMYQGMWIYSWGDGILSGAQTAEMIKCAKDNNLNIIFPEVRKVGDAYYISETEPFASNIQPGYEDPLADIISLAHDTSNGKQYIEVHAWIIPYRVWRDSLGTPPFNHVLSEHPEWIGEKYDGSQTDGKRYLDPGIPAVTDYVMDVAAEIVEKYDVDGIHWDYFRYPGQDWGYNPMVIERFNKLYKKTGRPGINDPDFCNFRRDQIRHMGRKTYAAIKKIDWSCKISAATIGWGGYNGDFSRTSPYVSVFQDWVRCMDEGCLDINVQMGYKREYIESQARDFRDWCKFVGEEKGGRHAIKGPGIYLNSIEDSITQILHAMDTPGIDGLNFYVYHVTNKDGYPAEDFWNTTKADCFTEQRKTPPAPWIDTPEHGILTGTVRNNSIILDGAKVSIEGINGGIPIRTDGTGFYAFLKVPGEITYSVTASFDGLTSKTGSITVPTGKVVNLDFNLSESPTGTNGFMLRSVPSESKFLN
jgi:uncharacterized lipoprotein YddW (UPF0748 family)